MLMVTITMIVRWLKNSRKCGLVIENVGEDWSGTWKVIITNIIINIIINMIITIIIIITITINLIRIIFLVSPGRHWCWAGRDKRWEICSGINIFETLKAQSFLGAGWSSGCGEYRLSWRQGHRWGARGGGLPCGEGGALYDGDNDNDDNHYADDHGYDDDG